MESAAQHPIRVVVVDDVPEIRDIVQMMLESDGRFRIVGQAADGARGIDCVTREQPDVVLLDLDMPGMSGWDALPRIRDVAPAAAVIIFSGDDNPSTTRRLAHERGAQGFLQKGTEARLLASQLLKEIGRAPQGPVAPARSESLPLIPDEPPDVLARRLAEIIDTADAAIIARDLDGTILSWSPAAERIFGYTAAEIVGSNASQLLPDESTSELTAILDRVRAGERVELETSQRRKDGTIIDVELLVSPITNADGEVVATVATTRDLDDRDRRDRALARAVAQLDRQNRTLLRANEELDQFAYVASHDLAQPLQVIYGYLELLEQQFGDSLDPTAAEWLGVITRNAERMRRLVHDLLHYARLGSRESQHVQVDCNQLVADILEGLRTTLEERGAGVTIDPLPTVVGDRTQLGQVFQNLIANAIKYTPSDRTPDVHISAEEVGSEFRIHVDDNGSRVAPDDRTRIFEMFQRAAHDTEGTGLGLAIVKRVVEQHGGRIWAEDSSRGGSRFSFTLRSSS